MTKEEKRNDVENITVRQTCGNALLCVRYFGIPINFPLIFWLFLFHILLVLLTAFQKDL